MENNVRKIYQKYPRPYERENIDQQQLAKAIGVSQPTVSNWIKQNKYPRIQKYNNLLTTLASQNQELLKVKLKKLNKILLQHI